MDANAEEAASTTLELDSPPPHARVYDQAISISGSITSRAVPQKLTVSCDGTVLGSTEIFASPKTVLPDRYGFRLLARFPFSLTSERTAVLHLSLQTANGTDEVRLGQRDVVIIPSHLGERPYGDVVAPDRSALLHRENIYGFGPPLENPGAEMERLILEFLPAASSVLDLGCGAGAYGPSLIANGHRWLGAETQELCWTILERRGLPFLRLGAGDAALPLRDLEFDATIAIEVLEHIDELERLVAELARVTRHRLLVSVPNLEVLPYYAPLGIVPWHLLESTHVNFFTRASLRKILAAHFREVEVFSFGEPPVKTHEDIPVHVHLFALANK